jgi:REP element-mobilizing transposase RayT
MRYDPERHHRRSIRLRGYDYRAVGAYFITIVAQDRACLFGEVVEGAMRLNDAGRMVERWWLELNRRFPHVSTDAYVVMPNHFHGIVVIHSRPPDTTTTPDSTGAHGGGAHGGDAHDGGAHDGGIPDVGADLRVCPDSGGAHDVGADLRVCPDSGGARLGADLRVCPDSGGAHDVGADLRVCPDSGGAHDVGADLRVCPDSGGAHGVGADLRVCPDSGGAHGVGADLRVCPDSGGAHDVGADLRVCPDSGGAHIGAPLPTIVQWFKTMTTNEYIRMVKHAGWTPFQGRLWQRNYYEHIIRNERALERIRDYILTNPLHWHLDRENTHAIGINSLEEEWFG